MDLRLSRADPVCERDELKKMWDQIFPHDPFFSDEDWRNPALEAYWLIVDDVKVGLTVFQLNVTVADKYVDLLPDELGTMYILIVGLLPAFQGKGLGLQVKRWHIEYAKQRGDVKKLVSNHRRSNRASHSFNIKAGYRQIGIKPDYYPKPLEDSVVMEYVL